MNLLELAIDLDLSDAPVAECAPRSPASPAPPAPPAPAAPAVSFIISTYNRRDVLLKTLRRLQQCPVPHEVFIVDNASPDGTADAVASLFPQVRLLPQSTNRGSCAKNIALPFARAPYIVFLDDDSYPEPGSVERMLRHFDRDPRLGAAVFTVTLPDGSRECSAYPDVFIGCGAAFRRQALRQAGGLPDDFFMQAEEYDLSLRLLSAGWRIRTFDDLHVRHLKTRGARYSRRVTRLDVRNNLVLIARHFPHPWTSRFAGDWLRRYWLIASSKGHRLAFACGLAEGLSRIVTGVDRRALAPAAFEQFARIDEIRRRLAAARARLNLRRILFIDYGKNILPYHLAAQACALEVIAVADPRLSAAARDYRGIRLLDDASAAALDFDAAIVSNLSPVHARQRQAHWRTLTTKPVLDLFQQEDGQPINTNRHE